MMGWENFFIAEVGASAALTGLIFVGVSINLSRILSSPNLPDRALMALILLLTVLIVSSLLLVPGQSELLIGIELLLIALIVCVLTTMLDARILRKTNKQYRQIQVRNIILTQLAVLPYVIGGIVTLIAGPMVSTGWFLPSSSHSLKPS
ncbi:MAG TPA: hypothetical protein VKV20_04845 [Ktedonobacteraceae bacterium]|jgi:MFS-type transporter involved in bile tolerance (Atg22 family)|nr:hypothetical protein [Ktedonobacteraceae bacterium]